MTRVEMDKILADAKCLIHYVTVSEHWRVKELASEVDRLSRYAQVLEEELYSERQSI